MCFELGTDIRFTNISSFELQVANSKAVCNFNNLPDEGPGQVRSLYCFEWQINRELIYGLITS